MKHFINPSIPINKEDIKDYTVENVTAVHDTSGTYLQRRVFITNEEYKQYVESQKVYYIHSYNIEELIKAPNVVLRSFDKHPERYISPIIFALVNNEYHILAVVCNDENLTHLVDITDRLQTSFDYWKNTYTVNYLLDVSKDVSNDAKNYLYTMYFYDSYTECKKALLSYMIDNAKVMAADAQFTYMKLNNARLYEKEYNKRYNEEVEKLKEQITKDLEYEKEQATEQLSEYSKIISKLTEYDLCAFTTN